MKGSPGFRSVPQGAGTNNVQEKLSRALFFHRKGELTEARKLYEDILKNNKTHFDSLHLLGLIHHQTKNYVEAERLFSKAIRRNPNLPAAHSNYGNTLQELKRFDEAVASYDRAIALKSDDLYAYSHRGVALAALKRYDESLVSHDRAIELSPDLAEAHSNRGNALQEVRRFDEALASYDRAIALKPDYAESHYNRGNALHELKYFNEALASHDHAIALKPDFADPHYNRGMSLYELKLFDEAIASYDRAIELKSDFAQAHSNRGNALMELNRLDEALASHDRAIALEPYLAEAYTHRGSVLKELKRYDEALASHGRAIALAPDFAEAYSNRGLVLQELKRIDEALTSYDRAIALKPDYANAYWNKSLALLLNGDFENGWKLYEWRWKLDNFPSPKRNFKQPLWLGADLLQGKTILLHSEQGLGDAIQFCRYIELVAAQGARVIVEVPKTLIGLLQRIEGVSEWIESGNTLPSFDFHCPFLSLPLAFKTNIVTIPHSQGYLRSESRKVAEWGSRLGAKTKRRVGIAWSGSATHKSDHKRSIALSSLMDYLPGEFEYVSLQRELRETDKVTIDGLPNLKHFGNELNDFTDTAALCDLMDVVISVDTSIAHLSGALGKPTWILLPYVPDWRWLMDRDGSPWYRSLKLYRQESDRNWAGVLDRVSRLLKNSFLTDEVRSLR